MLHEKHLSREEALYRHFQDCLASLNRAWAILCELERAELEGQQLPPALAAAAVHMALIEYGKPFRESGSGDHKRHSLGLPLAAEEDHLLHRYLLEQRDRVLAHSASVLADTAHYAGKGGEIASSAFASVRTPELPSLADIKALIERVLDVFYAQLSRLQLSQNSPRSDKKSVKQQQSRSIQPLIPGVGKTFF